MNVIMMIFASRKGQWQFVENETSKSWKIHYNLTVHPKLKRSDIVPVILPPKGSALNPVELFNNACQQKVKHWKPPQNPKDEHGIFITGPRNFNECSQALSDALKSMKICPAKF